jgi:hypothetical protein
MLIPVLVALALFGGYALRTVFTRPTTLRIFAPGTGDTATFVVDGLRCRGTANFLASLYEETPGILSIETFASERTAVFKHDPKSISRRRIQEIFEAPIPFDDGTTNQIFKCLSVR